MTKHQLRRDWTPEEERLALGLKEQGCTWNAIAAELGRLPGTVREYFRRKLETPERKEKRRKRIKIYYEKFRTKNLDNLPNGKSRLKLPLSRGVEVDPGAYAEWQQTKLFEHEQSFTAEFLGDPLPTRSALYQKRLEAYSKNESGRFQNRIGNIRISVHEPDR